MRTVSIATLVATAGMLGGCTTEPSGSNPYGINVELTIDPPTVIAGTQFTARLALENLQARWVGLTGGASCLAFLGVYQGDVRHEEFDGTNFGCFSVQTTFTLAPRGTLTLEWTVRAGNDEQQAAEGLYRFRVSFNVPDLPPVEREFTVTPSNVPQ